MVNKIKDDNISKTAIDRIIELYLSLLLIDDCKKLVNEGKKYHLVSIYGQLRAILTDNSQIRAKRHPILLALSELLNIELKFFYSSAFEEYIKNYDLNEFVVCHFDFEFSLNKLNSRHKEIQLNNFLEKNIFVFKGKEYNFRNIINGLSDKLGGSHYDPTLPKDIADLSNLHLGDVPVLDNYLLQFVEILIPIALKIPKEISDCEIWFAFTLYSYPIHEIILFDISVPNRYCRISLLCQKNKFSLSITDLIGNQSKIDLDLKPEFNKLTILSISHCIKNNFESEINLYNNGDLLSTYNMPPLLLFNEYYWCDLSINKATNGNGQDFEFGVHQASFWNKTFTPEKRKEYVKSINEFNSKPLLIQKNKYAYVDKEDHKMKIMNKN
jgi:hypothetical protein